MSPEVELKRSDKSQDTTTNFCTEFEHIKLSPCRRKKSVSTRKRTYTNGKACSEDVQLDHEVQEKKSPRKSLNPECDFVYKQKIYSKLRNNINQISKFEPSWADNFEESDSSEPTTPNFSLELEFSGDDSPRKVDSMNIPPRNSISSKNVPTRPSRQMNLAERRKRYQMGTSKSIPNITRLKASLPSEETPLQKRYQRHS